MDNFFLRARTWASEHLARASSSLARRCLVCIVIYAVLLLALVAGVTVISDTRLANAFPTMETVLTYETALEHDRFNELDTPELASCGIAIFDARGARLYASSEKVAERILSSDLEMINDYEDNQFYEVLRENRNGSTHYRITLCGLDGESGMMDADAWCVLDEDLTVVEGDLFADRGRLTQREFDFIKGAYNARMTVERYDYTTVSGAGRTLVLVSPLVTDASFARAVAEANRLWLYALPVAIALTGGAAWYLVHQMKRVTLPLDRAIDAYRADGGGDGIARAKEAEKTIPVELAPVYRNFIGLMDMLRDARDGQKRIVADLSHDLKTPLAVLYGYAMAFCDGRVPEEDEQRYYRIIAEKSLAASELIDTLAAYAKMDHPDYIPHLGRRHAGELLRDIAHEATSVAEQSGCSVEVKLPNAAAEELPPILVDEQLFRRALLNLVGNACQHNPAGTQVVIFCERVPAASPRDELVRISVADTGSGIAPEIADTLFDPFVTRNTARTSNAGTGLGLAITQKCISLMSGTIYVAKRPREGFATEFVIDLPVAP